MRSAFRLVVAGTFLAGCCSALADQSLFPVSVPTKLMHNQWMIQANVGGKDGWYLLSTSSKTSMRLPRAGDVGPDGAIKSSDVTIGALDGGRVSMRVSKSPTLAAFGADGILGSDALANFTLAFDIEQAVVQVWTDQPSLLGQRGWILLLPVIGSSTQHAITLSIDDVDKVPYGIKCKVGDKAGLAIVHLSEPLTMISAGVPTPDDSLTVTDDTPSVIALDGFQIGDLGPFWVVGTKSAAPLPYANSNEIASFPLTSLPVRRAVFDGHTGTIVTEVLGQTGSDSVLLSRLLGIPLDIEDNSLHIRQGGALFGPALDDYVGGTVVAIGGIDPVDIVAALEGEPSGRLVMLRRLAHVRTAGYTLDFVFDSKPIHTAVKPPK